MERQIQELKKLGAKKIFVEKKSGASIEQRLIFTEAIYFVRESDIFMVEAIDRLGRNYDEIIQTVNLLKNKNVRLIITSLPIMAEVVGNPLFDRFIKDLIVQILAMIAEQERTESKRRLEQGIKIAKMNGVYQGRPELYSPTAKDLQKRAVYRNIIEELQKGTAISKIAKKYGINRQTVYRIKKDYESNQADS
ncbi:transposon DNA-invertase [Enterococcus faecalis]|uniref:Transposon Tn552 DNA-invertase bin3 n=2 Tax=Enterococcus faecalis TaxID=1351 RepID=A0AAX2KUF4_ENTFL|nr:transposon DNA-invertase [Enterococcus faecalis]EET97113.1 resolvase [Enterococcus faecalis T2]EEU71793.1 resolvase [Enterococcus faecalis HIP11704]EEU81229.1 resolvase [Enterococcus faecalis D6]EOD97110.1 resolvase [Enterococcus faecalis EnGen0076]EOE00772.1 resolvase [Enterococcus faecalis EnGen0075]EOE12041.1 resolvase [Enterococcus faecalis EnGen0080]EOE15111.1 resolvase [Enterococcus faecalis EnGen0060]EOE15638.1 resolvase [Enterococcus faecalis EnGen0079]EOE21474.1 resolvase [Ente